MADEEYLEIIKKGKKSWNRWREINPDVRPNLAGVDLRDLALDGLNLSRAFVSGGDFTNTQLRGADFHCASLIGCKLKEAQLFRANLSESNLSGADLSGANLTEADLRKADFGGANLRNARLVCANFSGVKFIESKLAGADATEADFSETDIVRSDLSEANLYGVNFRGANLLWSILRNANCDRAVFSRTLLAAIDLRQVKGIETARHIGPSTVGLDTIYLSQGDIPEKFLRGAGVPSQFLTYMKSLVRNPIEYYSCFISYSSKDQEFAELLHKDLERQNVPCWFAPEDLKIGDKFRVEIDEAVRLYDKLLLVLSENSIESQWVEEEVEAALEKDNGKERESCFLSDWTMR